MSEKTLLRRVVPAISFAGHRATKIAAFNEFNEFAAGVMAALVAVDHSLRVKRDATLLYQNVDRIQYKVNFQGRAKDIANRTSSSAGVSFVPLYGKGAMS